jgi:DNA-binding Xre family transcriptional regulator
VCYPACMDTLTWKLKEYLDERGLSVYALVQASELAPNTVYALTRGSTTHARIDTLAGILTGLRRLTGEDVGLTDILLHEVIPDPEPADDEDALLLSGTADLSATLDKLEGDLPPGEIDSWLEAFYTAAKDRAR